MALHYLDPEREPRPCPQCAAKSWKWRCGDHDGEPVVYVDTDYRGHRYHASDGKVFIRRNPDVENCGGTGRLGVEGAEPDVEVWEVGPVDTDGARWYWRSLWRNADDSIPAGGPYPTELAALEAARAALRDGRKA